MQGTVRACLYGYGGNKEMIQTVVSMALPVDEHLQIKKQRLEPFAPTGKEKRISVVTGTHGDELEGQFVCYELLRRLKEGQEHLKGIVDVYPALNPLGIDSITRGIPMFDLDMNRVFPGDSEGPMVESMTKELVEDLEGSDLCIDIHASNIFLKEMPQVRINGKRRKDRKRRSLSAKNQNRKRILLKKAAKTEGLKNIKRQLQKHHSV